MDTIISLFTTAAERYSEQPALIEPVEGGDVSVLTYRAVLERAR